MAKFVKLGNQASFFYDPATKFMVRKNAIVELTMAAATSAKVKSALLGGHLVYAEPQVEKPVEAPAEEPEAEDASVKKLVKKIKGIIKSGKTEKYQEFTFEDLKLVAESLGFEVGEGDTNESLIQAITEELTEK